MIIIWLGAPFPRKVGAMLTYIKKRLSETSEKCSGRNNKSNGLVINFKRAFASTPELLKLKAARLHQNFSTTSLHHQTPGILDFLPPSSPTDSKINSAVGYPGLFQDEDLLKSSKSTSVTKVLFSPSKEKNHLNDYTKMKSKFGLRKNKSVRELQASRASTRIIPTITLTMPHDEKTYILHRPTPLLPAKVFLTVPTKAYSKKDTPQSRQSSSKRWPHPGGPWLRPTDSETLELQLKSDPLNYMKEWRLGTGKVIGWDSRRMSALGIALPPQLPTEQDLHTIALVQQISVSLDQAQSVLCESLGEIWDEETESDEFKIMDETWDTTSGILYDPFFLSGEEIKKKILKNFITLSVN